MTSLQTRNVKSPFNNLLDDFFAVTPSFFRAGVDGGFTQPFPAVNVIETETGMVLEMVAPGYDKSSFQLDVVDKTLTISATVEATEAAGKFVRKQYSVQSFKRSFNLGEKIDADGICAKYVNGVLTVNLPVKNTVKEGKKQITIE